MSTIKFFSPLMNIGFVEPAFLSALALIAVPIIVHLFNFRKFKVVYFSNVSFLKELKEETNSRSKLKHLLVLASRILAVVFLVFAFAQPFIPRAQGTKSFPGNVVSIYIDNSFSMEALGTKGTRIEEATNIARDIAKSYKPSDRFQLLTSDFDAANQRLISREEFLVALDQVELSPTTRTVSEVLSRQTDLLNTGGSSNKLAIQISDFQKSTTNLSGIKPDSTISVLLVPIGSADADNISIDSCWLASPIVQPGQITEVNVRVRNHGNSDITSVPLKFSVNGSPKSAASVDLTAGSFQDMTLTFTPNDTGWYNCVVSLEDNAVLFDDRYYFSIHVEPSVPMVCINGQAAGSYFRSLFPQEGYFKLQDFSEKQVNYGVLAQARVVILNEVRQPSSGMVSEIEKFVRGGGIAIIIPDSTANAETYSGLSSALGIANIGPLRNAPDKIDRLQTDDPVFSGVFTGKSGVGASTDLPVVNRSFQLNGGVPEVLLRLRSGEPYLNRYRVGGGGVYMLGSSLSGEMSGLAKHAIFVPVFYRMALLATNPQALAVFIGTDASLDIPAAGFSGDRIFKLKGGSNGAEFIPTHRMVGSSVKVNFGNTVREAGAYQLRLDGNLVSNPSFNYNRAESVMSFNDADMLSQQIEEARLVNFKVDATSGAKALAGTLDSTGIPLWKYCIILALVFLTIEILLLKFWKK